tara:strand:- start:40 stop:324 length:285 start_codon:yes stop_codon:yes gene_type:complete
MFKYLIIDTDGEETHVESKEKPDLKEMQEMVGGYIEIVKCKYNDEWKTMILNEEGKLRNLDLNTKATEMYSNNGIGIPDVIVGTAILFKNFDLD